METKWYHDVKWTIGPKFTVGPVSEEDDQSCGMVTPIADVYGDWTERHIALIAAAPETATQRDSLLSVQKQLVEALELASAALYEASDKFHVLSFYVKDEKAHDCAKARVDEMSSANVVVRAAILAAKELS